MSDTNGTTRDTPDGVDLGRVAELLQDEATLGYRPVMPLESLWLSGTDMPQITLRRDLEFMQFHPVVISALEYYRSGIAGAEFWGGPDHNNPDNKKGKPISADQRVSEFVLAHVERFWQRGMPLLQEGGYLYGWAAGEHIYKENNGMLVWSHLKDFHPNDAFILTHKHQPVGIRIKNIRDDQLINQLTGELNDSAQRWRSNRIRSGTIDLWFASGAIPAKACWYPHRPRFNQFYGRSQLLGAWLPWRMIGWRDGMDQVINAAVYRAGFKGPIVRHPMEDMQTAKTGIPATQMDGQGNPRRSARDVARQLVEWAKAGAGFTLSSAKYPDAQGGGNKWDIEWPDHVMDVRPLIEAARWAEERIMLGIGVPPELVKAGGTGSGYSGRSIPREAFLDQQQRIADAMLQIFVEQVVKPLVLWNFGDIPFEVSCKSLLESQAENKQGGTKDPLPQPAPEENGKQEGREQKNGQQPSQQSNGAAPPPTAKPPQQQPPSAPMAIDLRSHNRVLGIVQRVLAAKNRSLPIALSAAAQSPQQIQPPDVIVHNHNYITTPVIPEQAPPTINVNVPQQEPPVVNVNLPESPTPIVNVAAPKTADVIINVPSQPPPIVNVAAPTVHVVEASTPQGGGRKVTMRKDNAGNWVGEVENKS